MKTTRPEGALRTGQTGKITAGFKPTARSIFKMVPRACEERDPAGNPGLLRTMFCLVHAVILVVPPDAAAVLLDDGGTYIIDYAVSDGLRIENGTTVDLNAGASISSSTPPVISIFDSTLTINNGVVAGGISIGQSDFDIVGSPVLNINGGDIQGGLFLQTAEPDVITLNVSGGTIQNGAFLNNNNLFMTGGSLSGFSTLSSSISISDGVLGSIGLDEQSSGVITGGSIGPIDLGFGSTLDIFGGIYNSSIIESTELSEIDIRGGFFDDQTEFTYTRTSSSQPSHAYFTFRGDLSLSDTALTGANTGETTISDTLADGTAIANQITCNMDSNESFWNNAPCSGLEVLPAPVPASIWLFGTGLIVLTEIARRRRPSRYS